VLERARRGDPAAVKAVVDACLDPVYGICHRMLGRRDAADVAQDAIVKLISGLPGFDGRAAITTWATRIAMNACLGHLRRERYRRHASLDAGGSGNDGGEGGGPGRIPVEARELGPSAGVQREESIDTVRRALDSIDPSARAIIVLRDLQGLEYERIAEVLDVAVGTVKSRLYRARATLRERLEQLGQAGGEDDPPADGPPADPPAGPPADGASGPRSGMGSGPEA
jgi:RNA polymerase sigma-70 factor (ECF subfamily)